MDDLVTLSATPAEWQELRRLAEVGRMVEAKPGPLATGKAALQVIAPVGMVVCGSVITGVDHRGNLTFETLQSYYDYDIEQHRRHKAAWEAQVVAAGLW